MNTGARELQSFGDAPMPQDAVADGDSGPREADSTQRTEPSILNAVPHYQPLAIFPLIVLAAFYGSWWLLPPLVFMAVSGPLDRVLGLDGRNMDPAATPERRLLWHNLPLWIWAFLWPPTLVFALWQTLVTDQFAIWEGVLLGLILTMEAQAVFIVDHELVHRRSTWVKTARRIPSLLGLLSPIRDGACLYPPCQRRQAARCGLRAKGAKFLEILPQGSCEQSHEFVESCR